MKRVVLFLLTNLAVMLVLGVVVNLLGLNTFISRSGLNLPVLFGFALVFGMGGSFISLLMSKWVAKASTGAEVIEQPAGRHRLQLRKRQRRHPAHQVLGVGEQPARLAHHLDLLGQLRADPAHRPDPQPHRDAGADRLEHEGHELVHALAATHATACVKLGTVGGDRLRIGDLVDVTLDGMRGAYEPTLERLVHGDVTLSTEELAEG